MTFITPYGRFRYITAPQGWLATGDGYTQRYDNITKGIRNKRQCVDDCLLYSDNMEDAFKDMTQYLTLVGRNGIILNPEKFNFAEDTVDWAGVRISKDKVEPLPEHVQAIRDYPPPTNLTDMRSFFALVEQVFPPLRGETMPSAV